MITVNGYAFPEREFAQLLFRMLWKQVPGLATVESCEQAADAVTGFLAAIGPGCHPHGGRISEG